MLSFAVSALALAGAAAAQSATGTATSVGTADAQKSSLSSTAGYSSTSAAAVHAAQATALTTSPDSHVPGAFFDRFVTIWFENTDYATAMADPNFAAMAKKGVLLDNYFGVTHPSEPNYVAAIGGDNFGMDNDDLHMVPQNVSTVVDLLEARGISWGEYQEDMPYSGYQGFAYINQTNGKNDYVRKHNPAIIYNANTVNQQRLSQIKNFTMFHEDLANNRLPQWMFITPNMTDDAHDTSVTVGGQFLNRFVTPLLNNTNFMQRTLVLITFDENHSYTEGNRVMSILLGDSIPKEMIGTTDSNFYDHYSEIHTVTANWNLNTLGRWDVGANVFEMVAQRTGDRLQQWPAATGPNPTVFLNESYPGPYNSVNDSVGIPTPNLYARDSRGRTVLPEIVAQWSREAGGPPRGPWFQHGPNGPSVPGSIYSPTVEIADGMHPPPGY